MVMAHSPSAAASDLASLPLAEDLTPLPEYKAAGTASLDLDGLLTEPLQLHEDVRDGCGGQLWPAGLLLAKHMLRHHQDTLRDARILELGAGGGLVGLAVARGCKINNQPLLITDQAEMLSLMRLNIALNDLELTVQPSVLNWGEALPREVVELKPDVILAADCVYFEPAFPLLLQTLQDLVALSPAATVYFCFKKRRRADMHFLKAAKKVFVVTEPVDDDRPGFSRDGLFLYTFTRRR